MEAALIEENDPPIWSEILDYLIFHPETTDQQLIELYQDEDEEILKDFNRRFKSALESLPMTKLQWEFGQIFSPTDIRYFLGFYDAGGYTHDTGTQKMMIRLIWQEFFKELFDDMYREDRDNNYPGTLDDLTEDDYLTGPP